MCGELSTPVCRLPQVDCEQAREALSARLDGAPVDGDVLEAHLQHCAACRAWEDAAFVVTRRARLLAAPIVPDLAEQVVAAVAADRRHGSVPHGKTAWRLALLAVAAVQLALAAPLLLGGTEHSAHETAAFTLALAAGYAITALQPYRAAGLLPFAGIAAGLLGLTAVTDIAGHRTDVREELPHLLAAVGFLLLFRCRISGSGTAGRQRVHLLVRPLRGVRRVLHRPRRAFAVALAVVVAVLLSAYPASAHPAMESTNPVAVAVLPPAAGQPTLHLDEPVNPAAGEVARGGQVR
jgi:predicted anti-sigma-YlaC factor YlaD